MKVLLLGSGGREHALAWRIARDPQAPEVTVAPGNDGIAARFATVPLDLSNIEALGYLEQRLREIGVIAALERAGFEPGGDVRIGEQEFELD